MAREMDMDELGTYAGDIKQFMKRIEEELTEYVGVTDQLIINRFCDYLDAFSSGLRKNDSSILSSIDIIEGDIMEKIEKLLYEEEK
jgi:hypothetical protein